MTASEHHDAEPVLTLGEFAQAAVAACATGAVSAVFRRSFYVQFGTDVVCFGPPELGKGPINILVQMPGHVEWPRLGLAPRQKVWSSGSLISVADRIRFDLRNAEVWQPPLPPRFSFDVLRTGLERLSLSAAKRTPGGLAAMLVGLDTLAEWPRLPDDALLQAARAPVRDIAGWVLAGGHQSQPSSMQKLVGLGPGLTPSGDDFICGVMVALSYLGRPDMTARLAEVALPIASTGTNTISFQFLRCAAGGQASATLFDAMDAILTGSDLEAALDAIDAIGHTSGWDSLAGSALVCAALLEAQELKEKK